MRRLLEITNSQSPADRHADQALAAVAVRSQPRRMGLKQRALSGVATTFSELLGPRETQAFGIVRYRRIAEIMGGFEPPTWNVTPDRLCQQLEGLLQRGFEAWPLREVLAHASEGRPLPPRVFVITFDGAYENVYLNAFPILRRLELPATIFLATAFLDSEEPLPDDDWAGAGFGQVPYTAWRPLTTAECREMRKSGLIELGAHTHTQGDFRGRPAALANDLRRCQRVLREQFGIEKAAFAFPDQSCEGACSISELATTAQDAGLLCALSGEPRVIRPGTSPFEWGRFGVEQLDSVGSLAAKLNGWHEAVRSIGQSILRRNVRAAPASQPVADLDTNPV
jgi:peptidoglycan/xylan/chitin deacetylase (PgdA/CDA1 family)